VLRGNVISTHLTRYFISKLSPSLAYLNVMDNCLGIGGIDVASADPIALVAPPGVHSTKSCNVLCVWGGVDGFCFSDRQQYPGSLLQDLGITWRIITGCP